MMEKRPGISRREFARRAALASAAGALSPVDTLMPAQSAALSAEAPQQEPQQPADAPKLTPEAQTEAEGRYQAILNEYGYRFTADQKKDLHRLCYAAQPPLDRIRAYAVQNSDAPALYLKPLVERDKTPAAVVIPPAKKH
jgi:hypothetical protein